MPKGKPIVPWKEENGVLLKFCGRCETWVNKDKFHKSSSAKDGLNAWCKLCNNKYQRDKRREDPEWREELRIYNASRRKQARLDAINFYGGKCVRCGFDDWRALQFDHVDGGGRKELKDYNWLSYLKKVVSDTTGKYQLLCSNCNWIKKYENNETANKSPWKEYK